MYYKDINLLPGNKKKSTKGSRLFIYVLVVFTILSYVGNYYVYEPLQEKWDIENEIKVTDAKVSSYGDTASKYLDAIKRNNEYIEKTKALKNVLASSYKVTDIINAMVMAAPEGLVIKTYSYAKGNLTVTVTGKSYAMIADYITELKKVAQFRDVKFSGIALGENAMKEKPQSASAISYVNSLFGGVIPEDVLSLIYNDQNSSESISEYIEDMYGMDMSGFPVEKEEADVDRESYSVSLQITVKEN